MRGSNDRTTRAEPATATRRGRTTRRDSPFPVGAAVGAAAECTTGRGASDGVVRRPAARGCVACTAGIATPPYRDDPEARRSVVGATPPVTMGTAAGPSVAGVARSRSGARRIGCGVEPPTCSPASVRRTDGGAAPTLCGGTVGRSELDVAVRSSAAGQGGDPAGGCGADVPYEVGAAGRAASPRSLGGRQSGAVLDALLAAGLRRVAALPAARAGVAAGPPRGEGGVVARAIVGMPLADGRSEGAAAAVVSVGAAGRGNTIGTAGGSAARSQRRRCCAKSGSTVSGAASLANPRPAIERPMTPGRTARPASRAKSAGSQGPSAPRLPRRVTVASPHR